MTAGVDNKTDALWRWLLDELGGRQVPSMLAIIGLGDGALLDALERHAPATRVLALEPDAANARTFLSRPDAAAWRERGQLTYLVDPDYAGADDAWRIFPLETADPTVLVHPELALGDGVARAAQVLKKIIFGVQANAEARRRFAPRYLINSIRNIPAIVGGSDVRALADKYRGIPAVIAAAGPSLDDTIEQLRGIHDRALLIAADTALRPLLMRGIAPQLVIGLDPSEANLRHFLSLPECRDTWLVAESALDRHATAVFDDRTFWFRVANHHPWPWLNEHGIDIGKVDVWGSVLTGAFSVACLAGCDPVVVVGADLAYTGGRPYARGTTYEFNWAHNAALGMDVESCWKAQIAAAQGPITVPDIHGIETLSTESLRSFRDWMIARVLRSGRRVINATGAGIFHGEGIEQLALSDVLSGSIDVPTVKSHARRFARLRPSALASQLRKVRETVMKGQVSDAPILEWTDFSGGALDTAAVSQALEEAARTLETRRGRPSVNPVISWTRLATSAATKELLTGLPEAVARFRQLLADGEHAFDRGSDRCRDLALFEEAVRLLDEIAEGITRGGEVVTRGNVSPDDRKLVSDTYEWPEQMRWAILAFEALLGRVATTPLPETAAESVAAAGETTVPNVARAIAALTTQLRRCVERADETVVALTPGHTAAQRARALTGTLRTSPEAVAAGRNSRFLRLPLLRRPRVLSEEHRAAAAVSYPTTAGVVCVEPHRNESVLVDAGGSLRVHRVWPRPILNELPLGAHGAVAWGDGLSRYPEIEPAYLMYRHDADGEVTVVEFPARPTSGASVTWHNGRIYWSCFPRAVEAWVGLVSWAPGEAPKLEIPGLDALLGIHSREDGLALDPGTLVPKAGWLRQPGRSGWLWTAGSELRPRALASAGAASSRAVRGLWTATAYPQSDLVRLDASDGRGVSMNCRYPLRLAWLGESLLVSTGDRELLLFERLLDSIERQGVAS